MAKARTGSSKTGTSTKVQNKQANKDKRSSYRVEKESRKASRAQAAGPTVTTSVGGEIVQIAANSKQGKKLLAKKKRRAQEQRNERRYDHRHAVVGPEHLREVLQGKRTGTTFDKLEEKFKASKLAERERKTRHSMGDFSDEESDSTKPPQKQVLSAAQLDIQEMMERAKRTQQMDDQLAQLKQEKGPGTKKISKADKKRVKLQESKDYEDETEIKLDNANIDVSDIDSDEYNDGDEDDDDMYGDGDDSNSEAQQLGDSDDSDYEVRNKYRDQHATLIKNATLTGNRTDVRAAMVETLYDDLPKFKTIPAKMASLMKSRGQSVKEVESQRRADHDLKIKRILADRERRIREYDSDDDDNSDSDGDRPQQGSDDDSDASDKETDADFFLRLLQQKHARKVQRRDESLAGLNPTQRQAELERLQKKRIQKKATKKQLEMEDKKKRMGLSSDDDDLLDNLDFEGNSEDVGSEYSSDSDSDIEKAVSLVTLKQQTQTQRTRARNEMKELWLSQREERIQAAKERSAFAAGLPVPIASSTLSNNTQDTLSKKEQLKQSKQQIRQHGELQQERLMVLLDNGTWGYRDVSASLDDKEVQKPDLSAYVRKPKEKKKSHQELQREEREQADEEAPSPFEDGKSSNVLEKFEQFMQQGQAQDVTKSSKKSKQPSMDAQYDEIFMGEEDDDEDLEFESDEDEDDKDNDETVRARLQVLKQSIKPPKAAQQSKKLQVGPELDDDFLHLNDLDRISLLERKKMKQQMSELNTLHTSRLDRIRQVQLILGQLCTELLENPNKYVVNGHLEALLKLCNDKDSTIQQLAIASAATVFHDIIPDFRLKEHKNVTHTNDGITRLTKEVRLMRTYDNTFLQYYNNLLTLLNKFVHKGLSLFYAKQRVLWNQQNQSSGTDKQAVNPFEEYKSVNIDIAEKESTLYTIALQSACQIFARGYGFNFNTQIAHLLAHVLTSDNSEWSDIVTKCVSDVFKRDKCSDSTLEIVQTIGEVCKKRTGDKIRSPILSVLLEIPFNPQVIHYKDPNQARKAAKAKEDAKKAKSEGKVKGVTGAGHHYAEKQRQIQEKTMKQMKKAMRSGKEYNGPDPNGQDQKTLKDIHDDVQRSMRESEAVVSIEDRQKLQTKSLAVVFTIFFRYLKQAPTIKTLYNYNTANQEHLQQYESMKMAHTAQSTVHKSADMLSIPKEHRNQVILTQTMLGIVTPPTHFVLAIVLRGIMKFGQLINVELVLDLLQHLLMVIQAATTLESLSLSSSLLSIECIFTLLQMHGSAIDIDLAPHYQVLYNIVWQLIYHPEYSFLMIKCIDLAIIHRKHLPFRRVAAIVRRLYQVAMHLPPHFSLPLVQIAAQCCTAHPTIGAIYDNDKLQSGLYDLDHAQPDTSDAIATPAWEALSQTTCVHPYATSINLHALLSDLRIGTNTNNDGKTVGNNVDRSQLSISLTTIELPNETNRLERPQRVTRQIAISRLKPLELYSAIDISKGGFCPDVEAPDSKKLRKLMHYEWYDRHNWLSQVEELKLMGMFNHYDPSFQSSLMNQILGGNDTVSTFLESPLDEDEFYYEDEDDDEDYE